MPESIRHNRIEQSSAKSPDLEKKADTSEVEEFLDREAEFLSAYGFRGDITIERGSGGWAFGFDPPKLIYDPNFFAERGYSLQETLFATTHELIAHYAELLRDPDLILKESRRYCRKSELHLLHNIFEDVLGNRRVVAELPFLEEIRTALYKERLFPQTDYREHSSHVQFAYGFIRQMMVPGEEVTLGDEARQALEKLRAFGEDRVDVLDLVTTPTIEPRERFQIMRKIVEPIYLELYKKDLEEEKKKNGEKGSGGGGEDNSRQPQDKEGGESYETKGIGQGKKRWRQRGKSRGRNASAPGEKTNKQTEKEKDARAEEEARKKFAKEYKTYHDSHPEPLKAEDEENLKKMIEALARRGGEPMLDRAIIEQWAREHGVSPEDVLGYRREYKEIAPLVAELRDVFKRIVSKRLKERWKMSPQLEAEGEMLDEATLAESYVESAAGGKPRAFRELRRGVKEQEGYGSLDMTLVGDLSWSMNEGGKLPMERKAMILFLEALADFQKEIRDAEYESGMALGLEVRTEARAFGDFGDTELKPLNSELQEKSRIGIWKRLHKGVGGTPDYLSLEAIAASIDPEYESELRAKRKRKVVIVLSDGESQSAERVQRACETLRKKGVIVLGLGMTVSGQAVKETYKPDAEVIEDIRMLPATMQKVILKYTHDL